ncbi:hypothetical protein PENDEC_c003G05396 [Penicillium decumbens]|uniref:Uncharacterized protein n=1 Tax=Penicillium decumbens TaxID=69771 RepID=A0A1V6PJW6_PENDC|nr:hypothetical protein PENDEC_c003G05396 [Penicillium decumbens]
MARLSVFVLLAFGIAINHVQAKPLNVSVTVVPPSTPDTHGPNICLPFLPVVIHAATFSARIPRRAYSIVETAVPSVPGCNLAAAQEPALTLVPVPLIVVLVLPQRAPEQLQAVVQEHLVSRFHARVLIQHVARRRVLTWLPAIPTAEPVTTLARELHLPAAPEFVPTLLLMSPTAVPALVLLCHQLWCLWYRMYRTHAKLLQWSLHGLSHELAQLRACILGAGGGACVAGICITCPATAPFCAAAGICCVAGTTCVTGGTLPLGGCCLDANACPPASNPTAADICCTVPCVSVGGAAATCPNT